MDASNTPQLQKSTHLELQHVTAVVLDADVQHVNIWGVRATTAPILFVSNDVSCHTTGGFIGCGNSVAIIIRVEAPGNLFNAAGLKRKPTNHSFIVLICSGCKNKNKSACGAWPSRCSLWTCTWSHLHCLRDGNQSVGNPLAPGPMWPGSSLLELGKVLAGTKSRPEKRRTRLNPWVFPDSAHPQHCITADIALSLCKTQQTRSYLNKSQ